MTGRRPDTRELRDTIAEQILEPTGSGTDQHAPTPGSADISAKRRRTTKPGTAKPIRLQPTDTSPLPATLGAPLTGVVGDASSTGSRSGEDVRKRGWFWHWNSIVTQYAPLLGLKGVGLLNSYTVWTDRREESPHRGYAFPSQQSEADFYGEDRAELITINKILVALDLIEIRKEMVLRVDAQGRRWKVPHNLYRVKDHGDDVSLTSRDVMKVVMLADSDRAVYRYLRRLFSPRFSPIDHDNVWHQILEELRPTEAWQRLAALTERDETKASARTRAGHAARRGNDDTTAFSLPESDDNATYETTGADSTQFDPEVDNDSKTDETAATAAKTPTSVAKTNTGSGINVEQINNGSGDNAPSSVEPINTGQASTVAPANTTYYQQITTTTGGSAGDSGVGVRTERHPGTDRFGSELAPDVRRNQERAARLFEEANDRTATAAERRLLRQLSETLTTMGFSAEHDEWNLISSAIEEAVSAGSSFVAPKRIREILIRWSRDGVPAEYAPSVHVGGAVDGASRAAAMPVTGSLGHSHGKANGAEVSVDILLPNGQRASEVWRAVEQDARVAIGERAARTLLDDTLVVGYEAGELTIRVGSNAQRQAILNVHHELLVRSLRRILRRPIRLVVIEDSRASEDDTSAHSQPKSVTLSPRDGVRIPRRTVTTTTPITLGAMPVFMVERSGMTNRQLWSLVLNDLRERGSVSPADVDTWLRDTVVLSAVDAQSEMRVLIGVPHVLAQRRVEGRFRVAIRQALEALLGGDGAVVLEVAIIRDWLVDQQSA